MESVAASGAPAAEDKRKDKRKKKKSMGVLSSDSYEEQVAVVYTEELDAKYKDPAFDSSREPKKNKSMAGWSPFAKTVGEFYIEAGVERGA